MDYTNNPGTNQHPNKHDDDQLVSIYSHLDNTITVQQLVGRVHDFVHSAPGEWGKLIRHSANGKNSLFELELGNGRSLHVRDLGVINLRQNLSITRVRHMLDP